MRSCLLVSAASAALKQLLPCPHLNNTTDVRHTVSAQLNDTPHSKQIRLSDIKSVVHKRARILLLQHVDTNRFLSVGLGASRPLSCFTLPLGPFSLLDLATTIHELLKRCLHNSQRTYCISTVQLIYTSAPLATRGCDALEFLKYLSKCLPPHTLALRLLTTAWSL